MTLKFYYKEKGENNLIAFNAFSDYLFDLNKPNFLFEYMDINRIYEVEELNTNYYSTLLDFEQSNLQNL